jgi:hypothetical protein
VEAAAGKPDSANDGQPDCSNMSVDGIVVVNPRIDDGYASPNSCCCILVNKGKSCLETQLQATHCIQKCHRALQGGVGIAGGIRSRPTS